MQILNLYLKRWHHYAKYFTLHCKCFTLDARVIHVINVVLNNQAVPVWCVIPGLAVRELGYKVMQNLSSNTGSIFHNTVTREMVMKKELPGDDAAGSKHVALYIINVNAIISVYYKIVVLMTV
jgi:hypothetical protein